VRVSVVKVVPKSTGIFSISLAGRGSDDPVQILTGRSHNYLQQVSSMKTGSHSTTVKVR
jgi:hypothetical protein